MRRLLFWILVCTTLAWADTGSTILHNGVIHTATEEAFTGWVEIEGRRIKDLGRGEPPRSDGYDLHGMHLYPALIDADSAIGLTGVESLRATRDYKEVGRLNPNLVARNAFRAEAPAVGVTRSQGVLYSGVNPRGSLLAGQGSVIRLWGWTWEDMTVRPTWALSLDWPRVTLPVEKKEEKKRDEKVEEIGESLFFLQEAFAQARSYVEGSRIDVKWGALQPYARGEEPVMIRVDEKEQIRSALDWTEKNEVKPVFVAGHRIHDFGGTLAKRNIPVIYYSVFNQNPEELESYDLHYRVPKLLMDQGVTVALSPNGLAFDSRELRDMAGRCRAFGLSDVQALQMVTLNPARILGVEQQLGSLEKGKEASMVLCTGDILEVAPVVVRAWGAGTELDLGDYQKALYEKYRVYLGL